MRADDVMRQVKSAMDKPDPSDQDMQAAVLAIVGQHLHSQELIGQELGRLRLALTQSQADPRDPIIAAAVALYDNRLGHRDDNPQWSAPQELWRALGAALAMRAKLRGE